LAAGKLGVDAFKKPSLAGQCKCVCSSSSMSKAHLWAETATLLQLSNWQLCIDNRFIGRAIFNPTAITARAPIAAETAKLNLRAAFSMPLDKAIEYERDLQTVCFATEDAAEGRQAFKEKTRAPVPAPLRKKYEPSLAADAVGRDDPAGRRQIRDPDRSRLAA